MFENIVEEMELKLDSIQADIEYMETSRDYQPISDAIDNVDYDLQDYRMYENYNPNWLFTWYDRLEMLKTELETKLENIERVI